MKASPPDVKHLSGKADFFITPYGRSVYVSQWLDGAINWRRLEALVKRSYKIAAKETPARRRVRHKGARSRSAERPGRL
jgi:hypothetical protein